MRKNGVDKNLTVIEGGVCAPQGFAASGVHCGIRKNKTKKDLALIVADKKCATACVYTTNLVKGAPILVTKKNVADGYAQAVIVNSGNANTCNANGVEIAQGMCELVEKHCGIKASDVVVASTGVIGQPLSLEPIAGGMAELCAGLEKGAAGSAAAAQAIMTTDTVPKELSYEFYLGDYKCRIGAICKGVGMICPNMATMLMFVTTDANISPEMLQKALSADVKDSLNMVSVDRDTSTNDTLCIMASGLAGNAIIDKPDTEYKKFCRALHAVTSQMCRKIAADGEGATKLIECKVSGAKSKQVARTVAKSVVCSDLLKAAMFGADANWGRVLCAIGYSGADVDVDKIGVAFQSAAGKIQVCEEGRGIPFSEEIAKKILLEKEIEILVELNDGNYTSVGWGCDLTYEYVHINGDYRS
ncbi:MAG: bifunctional glutamate N-acetyltransferase/amino-acid acetyltransferase ArgJ [Clostridia bacterium]|nr:bifunctional glutamate N-acetyltransferase/amino-acid acetyltransferase ArgJ [Clostridia bacterium]